MSSPKAHQPRTTSQDSVLTESLILAKKLPLTTWNNLNPEPTIENQKKYHNKLMKPLQINNKRKLLTVSSNKNHQKYIEEPLQEVGYEELIDRVSEIKKISKHQDRVIGTPKKRDNGESHEYNLMRMNLSQDAMKTIELARENAVIQNESNSSRLYNSTVDQKDQNASSLDPSGRSESKQRKLATQLSNQMDKKIPKQLNSSAHFRHAKRKILLLRALDSVVNQKEIMKEAYSDVRSCREAAELAPASREHSIESYITPSLSTIRPTSKGRDAFETPMSKFALENAQRPSFYLPSANLDSTDPVGSFNDVTTSKNIRLPLSENCINTTPKAKAKTVIISHKKSPVGSISNFLKDSEYFNSSQELEQSQANTKPNGFDGKIMRMQTIDSVTYEFTKSQFAHSKSQFFVEDENLQSSKANFSGSRKNRTQQKIKAEFQEQRDKAFKHELRLTMRNEPAPTSIVGQASTITAKVLRTSKSVTMLKHIRKVSSSFESRSRRRDPGNTSSQSRTPRSRNNVENAPSEASIVVQKLIRSGFREDSTEKDSGKKETEMILNSYGFKETDALKKARQKSRFLTLEGYQGAFLKEAIARTQRHIESVAKKDNRDKDF